MTSPRGLAIMSTAKDGTHGIVHAAGTAHEHRGSIQFTTLGRGAPTGSRQHERRRQRHEAALPHASGR